MSGVDMSKMKEKLQKLRGEGGGERSYWKPQENSKHRLRFLLHDDSGDPFKEYHNHYGIADQRSGFLCPERNFGEECEICEFATEMYEEGKAEGAEQYQELAKDLWPSVRYYSAIVEIEQKDDGSKEIIEGPSWYNYSETVYEELLDYMLDQDYNDFTDLEKGHDVKLSYTKGDDDLYPETSIKLAPMPSALAESQERMEEILSEVPDISEVLTEKSEDEISQLLDDHMEQFRNEMEPDVDEIEEEAKDVRESVEALKQ